MPSSVIVDDDLLETARELGGLATKRATVHAALREYVARRKRRNVLEAFGTIDFEQGFPSRKARRSR